MTPALVDFAVVTIFAREFLEGSIIVGQYRTMVLLGGDEALHPPGTRVRDALRAITLASLLAAALALLVLACVAIPLAVLSKSFDPTTGEYIEAASKSVAAVSLLILSLKIPRFLGIYGKRRRRRLSPWKVSSDPPTTTTSPATSPRMTDALSSSSPRRHNNETHEEEGGEAVDAENDSPPGEEVRASSALNELNRGDVEAAPPNNAVVESSPPWRLPERWWHPCRSRGARAAGRHGSASADIATTVSEASSSDTASHLTLREIKFNVAWNLWREVAECGAFLLPFFLTGNGTTAIPLSAVIGGILGIGIGCAVYAVNRYYQRNRVAVCVFATLLMVFFSAGLFTDACHIFEEELGSTTQIWHLQGRFWDSHALPMTLLKPFGYDDSRTVLEIVSYWLWLALAGLLHYHWYKTSPRVRPASTTTPATAIEGLAAVMGDDNDTPPRLEPSVSLESTASPSLTADAVDEDDNDSDIDNMKKERQSRASCATTDVETTCASSLVDPLGVEVVGNLLDVRESTHQPPLSIDV